MPWQIKQPENAPIIEIQYSGVVTPADLAQGVGGVLELVKRQGITRVLTDCTSITGGPSPVELFFRAESAAPTSIAYAVREAVLLPRSSVVARDVEFWETTCRNRGLQTKVFTDREEAIDWLLESKHGDKPPH